MKYAPSMQSGSFTIAEADGNGYDGNGYFELWRSVMVAEILDVQGKPRRAFNVYEQIWAGATLTRNDGALIPVEYCGEILVGIEDRILAAAPVDQNGNFRTHFMAYDLAPGKYSLTVLYPGYPRPAGLAKRSLGDIKGGITYFTANPSSALEGQPIYADFEIKNWDTWWSHKFRVTLVATSPQFTSPIQLYLNEFTLGTGNSFSYHGASGLTMPGGDVTMTLILELHKTIEGWTEQGRQSLTINYIASPPAEGDLYILPSAKSFMIEVTDQPDQPVEEKAFPWWILPVAATAALGLAYMLKRRGRSYPMPYGGYG